MRWLPPEVVDVLVMSAKPHSYGPALAGLELWPCLGGAATGLAQMQLRPASHR